LILCMVHKGGWFFYLVVVFFYESGGSLGELSWGCDTSD
jgi:hypothetical protein